MRGRILLGLTVSLAPLALAACGGSSRSAATTAPTTTAAKSTTARTTSAATTTAPAGPGALTGEAFSAAAGDIPDNQVFVSYAGPAFTIKVPEGWARRTSGSTTVFRDKNNIVRVALVPAAGAALGSLRRDLAADKRAHVTKPPHVVQLGGKSLAAATYTTKSAPNPVTGKSVTLTVDRYEMQSGGKRAIVDLGTPVGVDNVDAYRMMVESFRLR